MLNNLKYNLTIPDLHSIPVLYNLYKIPSHLLSIPRVNMNVCCDCLTVRLWTNLQSKKIMTKNESKNEMYKHVIVVFKHWQGFRYKICINYLPFPVFCSFLALAGSSSKAKKKITLQMSTFYGYSFFFFFCFAC